MLGGCTTCTAMSGSGATTGMAIIHEKTWLTRQDQKKVNSVCCVAVRGTIFLKVAARPAVSGMSLAAVAAASVSASVSSWSDLANVHAKCCSAWHQKMATAQLLSYPTWFLFRTGSCIIAEKPGKYGTAEDSISFTSSDASEKTPTSSHWPTRSGWTCRGTSAPVGPARCGPCPR